MTTWWSTEKINATISQEYIEKELGTLRNREALHRVLQHGDGLTDSTYLDWVLERSPRFFLILNDLGYPQKIFDVIDRSHDDDDLPLDQDALWELNLFGTKSETLDKKFHKIQHNYLVQDLEPGGHVDYGPLDIVPVEPVVKRAQINKDQVSDKVYAHDHLYTRKRVPTSGNDAIDRIQFILHLKGIASIQDPHIVSVFATYSQDNFNYVLLTPSTELNLKQIFNDDCKQFKLLEKTDRREIVLTWAHCITSALAYLHDHGFDHRNIRPSTILVDQNSKIFLSEYNALNVLDYDESIASYKGENYDHSPPENWLRKPCLHETAPLKTFLPGGSRTSRRLPKTAQESVAEGKRRASTPGPSNSSSNTGITRTDSKSASSSGSSTNARPRNALITTFAPQSSSSSSINKKQYPADIFSLTTVLLTLLSYLLGHSPKTFASHRSKYNRQAGRGNAPPDASFHKNLKQVESWIDKLSKDAGQKEKKDVKYWGAVVELVSICRLGINKEPSLRIGATELEKKVGGWVEWGLGRRRRCTCHDKDKGDKSEEQGKKEGKPRPRVRPPKRTTERISYTKQTPGRYWTTPSEDVSQGSTTQRNSYATWSSGPPRNRDSFLAHKDRDSLSTERGARDSMRTELGSVARRASLPAGPCPPHQRDSVTSETCTNSNSMSVQMDSKSVMIRPTSTTMRRDSYTTQQTEVWGLDGALAEEDENEDEDGDYDCFDVRTELAETEYDEDDEGYAEEDSVGTGKRAWPLPPHWPLTVQPLRVEPLKVASLKKAHLARMETPTESVRKGSLTNYERLEQDMLRQREEVTGVRVGGRA